jgi:hypothetical protein
MPNGACLEWKRDHATILGIGKELPTTCAVTTTNMCSTEPDVLVREFVPLQEDPQGRWIG